MKIIKVTKMATDDWQCSLDVVKDRIIYLYNSCEVSDCEFVVGDEKEVFKAHKLILSMTSPVFYKMFNGKLNEEGAVLVPDTKPKFFGSLLKYIYTDVVSIETVDDAFSLYYLADKYMLLQLGKQCNEYIQKNILTSNVCQVYEFTELFTLNNLKESCKQMIITKTTEVINDPNFTNIQKETLLMIMELNSLDITSEVILYHAVMKWAIAETIRKDMNDKEQLMSLYEEILTKIRFVTMEPKEFAEGPAISEYISADDARDIFINISSSNTKRSYPEKYQVSNWNKCRCNFKALKQSHKSSFHNYGYNYDDSYDSDDYDYGTAGKLKHAYSRSEHHINYFHK